MKIELTQPFRLTPFTVVSLDFAVTLGLYVIYTDNYRITSSHFIGPYDHHISAWFDVLVLSGFRTLFIILGLSNIKSNRPMIITVVCLLVETLLMYEMVIYGLENLTFKLFFYFSYPQFIGLLEILSAVLPPKIELFVEANTPVDVADEDSDGEIYKDIKSTKSDDDMNPTLFPQSSRGSTKKYSIGTPSTVKANSSSDGICLITLYKSFSVTYKRVIEMEKRKEMWSHVCTKEGVEIFKCSQDPLLTIKGIGYLTVSPLVAFMIISNFDLRKKWDYLFDHGREITRINDSCRILHLTYKSIWPTASRELCVMEDITVEDNGNITMISKSVEHREASLKPGNVRADLKCCGGFISRVPGSPGKSRVQLIAQADLGGSIPIFVANYVAVQQPMCLATVQKFIDQNPEKIAEIEREASVLHKTITEKRGSLRPAAENDMDGRATLKFATWAEKKLAEYERIAN